MRILIALVVIAAAAWSGYWLVGARALDRAIRAGIADLRDRGVQVETADISVTGFPNRFDTIVDAPRIAWPNGVGWSAPFLQVFALSYRPNQIIAAFPETQTVSGPFGTAIVETARARASALFRPGPALVLDHANLVAEDVRIASGGKEVSAARVLAATRVPEGAEADRQNIGLTLDDVDLPATLAGRLGGGGAGRIDGLTLDAFLDLSAPVSRKSLAGGDLSVTRIEVSRLDMVWGEVALGASGALDVAPDGMLSGEIELTLTNWQRAIEIATRTGLLPAAQRQMAEQGLSALSALSSRPDRLTAPLSFRGGWIYLGPVPLGPAPRL